MNLKESLTNLVDELDRIHSMGFDWSKEFGMPDFVTASNGLQRHFTKHARVHLRRVVKILHSNRPKDLIKIEVEVYEKRVMQVVANMHADGEFSNLRSNEDKTAIKKLKSEIESGIEAGSKVYTHYFPAWTAGMDRQSPFVIGPVSFINRNDWIDMVDFPDNGKKQYLNEPEANYKWKEILRDALEKPRERTPITGLAATVHRAVEKCPSLIKVTITGYEKDFSRKLAHLSVKLLWMLHRYVLALKLCFNSKYYRTNV